MVSRPASCIRYSTFPPFPRSKWKGQTRQIPYLDFKSFSHSTSYSSLPYFCWPCIHTYNLPYSLLCPRRGSVSSHSQPHTTSRSTGTHPTSTTSTSNSASSQSHVFSRTPDDIRASTVELSSMAMPAPPPSLLSGHVQPHQLRTPLTAADIERAVAASSRRTLSFAGAFLRPPVSRLPEYGSERDSSAVSFSPPSVSFHDTHVRIHSYLPCQSHLFSPYILLSTSVASCCS